MAKRRLSQQQRQRIQRQQDQRIQNSRNDASSTDDDSLGPEQQGLITARYSRHVDVKSFSGDSNAVIRCHVRATVDSITVGDRVVWRETAQGDGVVVAVEPRRSVIERPDGLGKLKPIAANIDQVFIVFAVEPEPHPNLIDRYLVAAENAHIQACLVFNKIELLDDEGLEAFDPFLDVYRQLGYPVYEISCHNNEGLAAIRTALKDKTSIFAGQSGVGKTSMINALLPEIAAKVGELSDLVGKGKHTTTTASLFELPEGGNIIDSPGIREFHLNHLSREQIYAGYRELQPLLGHCQFRDCQHQQEPGCVINAFIDDEQMAATREESLQYILNSLDM